jgi:group I intron endonuclease
MKKLKEAVIYWIRLPEHNDITCQGYVGVSKNFNRRITEHIKDIKSGKHKNPHLIYAVKKYGWENLIKEQFLSGDEKFCYEQENILRKNEKTGWNISRGGHRGPGRHIGSPGVRRTPEEEEKIQELKRIQNEIKLKKREEKRKNKEKQSQFRPLCSMCNELPARSNGTSVLGYQRWQKICNRCAKKKYSLIKLSDHCNECGFEAANSCQLCLVDGVTICQNCNALRLKERRQRTELTVDATVNWGNLTL